MYLYVSIYWLRSIEYPKMPVTHFGSFQSELSYRIKMRYSMWNNNQHGEFYSSTLAFMRYLTNAYLWKFANGIHSLPIRFFA
jgi:hypothetical protein